MPTPTYTPLATVTLGASAASVTFSSIPATYRDLILVIIGNSSTLSAASVAARPNNDSVNASGVFMVGTGSTTSSATFTSGIFVASLAPSNLSNSTGITHIMDYSATDKHKTFLNRNSDAGDFVGAQAERWASTSAITSLVLIPTSQSLGSGTTFSLYGVIA
jgi:hypothetical protein